MTRPARIRLNSRPPDWRTDMVFRKGEIEVRTTELGGPVLELDTPYAGIRELVALSEAFGGCTLEVDGRFVDATYCPPVTRPPELEPLLREFVENVAAKVAQDRAREQRVRAAIDDISSGGDPLAHEGFDWSD